MKKKKKIRVSTLSNQDVKEVKTRARKGKISEALQLLGEKTGGILTPYDVVKQASSKSSPLHNSFEWDDTKAGKKYRLMQARLMLTTVKIEFMGEKQKSYYNATVSIDDTPTRAYFPVQQVMSDKALHREVLRQAVAELEHAERKYEHLKQFQGVINTKKLKKLKKQVG